MSPQIQDRPEYAWLNEYKRLHGQKLQVQHGAHSLGIGWKKVNGKRTDELALRFYTQQKQPPDSLTIKPIPSEISFTPQGATSPVLLKTDVIEMAPPTQE